MNFSKRSFIALILLVTSISSYAQQAKKFESGARVAFVGNSITEAGYYESYIWLYYMTRFPQQRIEVLNAGIGGNTAKDIVARFSEDVLKKDPTAIVLTFGMNDSGYFEYNQAEPEKFADSRVAMSSENFMKIVEQLKQLPNVEKIMMSSSPYDETMKNPDNYFPGKSKTMERIIAVQQEVATKNAWSFVDLYYPMKKINEEGQKQKPEFTIIGKDRIHPGNGGHLVMAYFFLKSQGLAGKPIADVAIDAKKKSVIKNVNAKIENLAVTKEQISFDYLAESLPFPIDSASRMWGSEQKQSDALTVVPFMQDINQEIIKISQLPGEKYEIRIDKNAIGSWTKAEFEAGVNLALIGHTPQYRQATKVMHLNQARKDIEGKMREYVGLQFNFFNNRGMLFKDDQEAWDLAKRQAKTDWTVSGKIGSYQSLRFPEVRQSYVDQMKLIVDLIYKLNKPEKHTIEIVKVN